MVPVFIFARDVQDVLLKGKKEIEIPEGTRVSASALDLIKEKRIKIIYTAPQIKTSSATPLPDDTPPEKGYDENKETKKAAASKLTKSTSPQDISDDISEKDLEDIVNRVIKRFRQIKEQDTLKPVDEAKVPADDDDLVICRCEEITKGEIKDAIRNGMKTLNGIKRITRAGMGLCQGQTCQRLVTRLLVEELGVSPAEVEPTTARGPVRPLPLSVFATG